MQVKTEAIVINAIRYAEADLIVKTFTKQLGAVSFMVKGVLKSKRGKLRASFFQIGSFLEVDAIHKTKNRLHSLKEVNPQLHFKTLHSDIVKSSLLTFLFEIISQVLIDEEADEDLFQYFKNSFLWLDNNNEISLFHLLFLIKFTSFLGCYPDVSEVEAPEFDLESGKFVAFSKSNQTISGELLINFKTLLGMEFDDLKNVSMLKQQRKDLLQVILNYYNFHVSGYREPKSLLIFEQLFN